MSRPSSSASRAAWDDPSGQHEEMAPAAMESEMYVDGNVRRVGDNLHGGNRSGTVATQPQTGCWFYFQKGVRALWATRLTEDTEEDRELYVKTTLRELIVYVIFLLILCVLTFGMTSTTMFYYTKVMSTLFLDSSFPDTKNTFRGMTTIHDFWRFAESALVDGLYWEQWYNGENVSESGYIYYENKLLGVPRLRQLRVRNDSCVVHEDFKNEIKFCYDEYAAAIEDKNQYGPGNGTAWNYQTEAALDGSSHSGLMATYNGGGFIQNLGRTKVDSLAIIGDLKQNLWLDRGTRVVMVDFTVYNANINLFCVVRLIVEYPPTGGAVPSWSFRTVKLLRYVTIKDYFVLACEFIFLLFIIYYGIEEVIEISKHKMAYFKSFWNILDILVIFISGVCICFNVYRTLKIRTVLDELLGKPNIFPDFEFLSYWQMQFNYAVAVAVFFSWVKVFKYISFNKTMTQLSSTLGRCAKDLAGFAVMFFIIFFAFAQLGYLIFGTQIRDFSTFWNAVFTLFRIILGDFNFQELEAAHRFLGPAYFILYVFFVFFVLLNMFLAIINDTYSEVKADLANQESEFEMGDYFKKSYNKMLDKLNFKKEKIVDIQSALQNADMNGDRQLDFDEWRQDLKNRGFADTEIEAVFARYDTDGDRALDEEEQQRMMADLEGQKRALNQEFEDLEKNRPQSAISGVSDGEGSDGEGTASGSGRPRTRGGRRRHTGGSGGSGVSYEEFTVLSRRVDRMEHSIGSIVSKIDAVLVKLETMEKAKLKRRECMGKLLDKITESEDTDAEKRKQMEAMVREELEKWDGESSWRGTSARSGRTPRPNSADADVESSSTLDSNNSDAVIRKNIGS